MPSKKSPQPRFPVSNPSPCQYGSHATMFLAPRPLPFSPSISFGRRGAGRRFPTMADENSSALNEEFAELVLPDQGVVELTDRLTEYMTEIELGGMTDIIGQVLDDFIDQSGCMPDDLRDTDAFEEINRYSVGGNLGLSVGPPGRPLPPNCLDAGQRGRPKVGGPAPQRVPGHLRQRPPPPQGVGLPPRCAAWNTPKPTWTTSCSNNPF